jgi:hypothetical protein
MIAQTLGFLEASSLGSSFTHNGGECRSRDSCPSRRTMIFGREIDRLSRCRGDGAGKLQYEVKSLSTVSFQEGKCSTRTFDQVL